MLMVVKAKVESPKTYPIIVPTQLGNLQTLNYYLVHQGEDLILIDAGAENDACWDALIDTLHANDYTLQDITAIILTHNHADHIGIVNRIRKEIDVPLYAHEDAIIRLKRDTDFLEKRIAFFTELYQEMGCLTEAEPLIERMVQSIHKNAHQKINGPIIPLKEGDTIFGFDVIYVPGHAPDHIFLWHKESKTAYVGDLILSHSPSNALVELDKTGGRTKSLVLYEQSLQKLRTYEPAIAYSGHGEIIHDPIELIDQKLNRIETKADRILALLYEEKTAAEIAKEMYKDRYEPLLPLVMSEVIGHLDRLYALQKVTQTRKNGIIYYKKHM